MSSTTPDSDKLTVLRFIEEYKTILFGAVSPMLSENTKEKAWEKVAELAKKHQVIPEDKDFHYMKQTVWPNWERRYMEKLGKHRRFEWQGRAEQTYFTEADRIIMQIMDVPLCSNCAPTSRLSTSCSSPIAGTSSGISNNNSTNDDFLKKRRRSIYDMLDFDFWISDESDDEDDELKLQIIKERSKLLLFRNFQTQLQIHEDCEKLGIEQPEWDYDALLAKFNDEMKKIEAEKPGTIKKFKDDLS